MFRWYCVRKIARQQLRALKILNRHPDVIQVTRAPFFRVEPTFRNNGHTRETNWGVLTLSKRFDDVMFRERQWLFPDAQETSQKQDHPGA
jgi:hypothetical protein